MVKCRIGPQCRIAVRPFVPALSLSLCYGAHMNLLIGACDNSCSYIFKDAYMSGSVTACQRVRGRSSSKENNGGLVLRPDMTQVLLSFPFGRVEESTQTRSQRASMVHYAYQAIQQPTQVSIVKPPLRIMGGAICFATNKSSQLLCYEQVQLHRLYPSTPYFKHSNCLLTDDISPG